MTLRRHRRQSLCTPGDMSQPLTLGLGCTILTSTAPDIDTALLDDDNDVVSFDSFPQGIRVAFLV